jgi:hypothetical protein
MRVDWLEDGWSELNERAHRATFFVLIAAIFLNASSLYAGSPGAGPVGVITKVNGAVELKRGGKSSAAALSSKVLLNDVYVTHPSSSMIIILAGGGELDVGPSSSIRVDQQVLNVGARSTVISLLWGKLHSIVPFLGAGQSSFVVRTGNAICGVRGTDFETAYIEGKPCPGFPDCKRYTDVGVARGAVEVRSATNPEAAPILVSGGYETTVPCEEPPSSPSPLGASELESPGYH